MAIQDLYIWTPAVSVGGARPDNLNISGATKLNSAIDAGDQTVINAGLPIAASYSPLIVPSISDVNGSSDFNQIVAAINHRYMALYIASSESPNQNALTSSKSQDFLIPAVGAQTPNFSSAIENLRSFEGAIYSYSYPSMAAGTIILGKHLSDMRAALSLGQSPFGTTYQLTCAPAFSKGVFPSLTGIRINGASIGYVNYYKVEGALVTRITAATWLDLDNNQYVGALSGVRRRYRMNFAIPAWMTSIASLSINIHTGTVNTSGSPTGEVWSGASAGALDNLETTFAITANTFNVLSLPTSLLTVAAGGMLYLTLTTNLERLGSSSAHGYHHIQSDSSPLCLQIGF